MEFSIATLLSHFTDDKFLTSKILEKKLECEDETCERKLQIALDALEKIGILAKERGRYRREPEEDVVEAKLRCSSKGFCFAIQDQEGAEDIYIRESHLSTAWNGDRVLVKVIKEGSRRRSPEGEVRLILERANPSVLARVKDAETSYRAVPLDDRLLFEIELETKEDLNLQDAIDYLVHVEILRYPLGSTLPIGRVVQILGSDAETANDIDIVCCKHDLPRTFSAKVQEAAAAITGKLKAADMKKRQDLRKLITFAFVADEAFTSITDRAVSLTQLNDEQWQICIHLSDVAYHIAPDSPLDREALRRGTSICLGNTVIPILPENVRQACALVQGQERLALSLLIVVDATGEVAGFEIQPSTIEVDYQLTYSQAEAALDFHHQKEGATPSELSAAALETLDRLCQLGQGIREQRIQRGSFELALPESHRFFEIEEPSGVVVRLSNAIVQCMVRELSILCNQSIGEHLQALGIPAIHCVHPVPDLEDVQDAIKLASNMGVELWLEDEETLYPTDFKQFTIQIGESNDEKILTYLLEATLKPINYSMKPGSHFGLALESSYCHCSSPLNRYSDLLVQRALHLLFEQGRDRRSTRSKDRVDLNNSSCHGNINWNVLPPDIQQELEIRLATVVVSLTERQRLALEAEADWRGLQKAGVMKERTGEVFQGLITGVQSYGFFVELESGEKGIAPSRLEGLVHVSSLKDDWYEYRSRQQTLVGRKNRKQYRLGDRVDVQVKSVDYYRQQIDLAPLGGGSEVANGDYFETEDE